MQPFVSRFMTSALMDRKHGHRNKVLKKWGESNNFDWQDNACRARERAYRVSKLLNHAKCSVPYYQDILSQQPVDEHVSFDVLKTLPVITRADLQRELHLFCAGTNIASYKDATGGSTGTPLSFIVDMQTKIAREASLMWADAMAGWCLGERIAMLWGADHDISGALKNHRLKFRWWMENRRWYNAFMMGPDEMSTFHKHMKHFKPHILVSYAGSLYEYSEYLQYEQISPTYPLKSIISSAEMLSPYIRRRVEETFTVPIYDRYGNREVGAIAAECEFHNGLHINERDMIVEIDSPDPYVVPGPIIITFLHNYAMPFIRYNTGDLACYANHEPCACGRKTDRFKKIVGRQSDSIQTSSGKIVHGEYFTHLFYGIDGIVEFQFVQHSLMKYELLLKGNKMIANNAVKGIARHIKDVVGENPDVQIKWVKKIPRTKSGKRRFTISHVGNPYMN